MTKFSFEVPIAHLEEFEDLQDFHFSLSMLYKNKSYKAFMLNQIDKGLKTVWLDNSYNELLEATDHELLAELMTELDCHKVIAPDDPKWSAEKIFNSYDKMVDYVSRHQVMIVVSNAEMYNHAVSRGILPICVGYRSRMNMPFKELKWAKPCHFLGMLSVEELVELRPPSVDTSMPIKMAIRDQTLGEWEGDGHPHYYAHEEPNFFDYVMSYEEIILARHNIVRLKEIINEERPLYE